MQVQKQHLLKDAEQLDAPMDFMFWSHKKALRLHKYLVMEVKNELEKRKNLDPIFFHDKFSLQDNQKIDMRRWITVQIHGQ